MAETEIEIDQIVPGTANQLIGANSGATDNEYKTISGTTNRVSVSFGIGTITLSAPQDIATSSSPTFAGETLSDNLTLQNQKAVIFQDTEITPKSVTLEAPTTITTSYTLKWPVVQSSGTQVLTNDGSGNLSWTTSSGSGTVNSGTAGRLSLYNTSTNAVSDTYVQNTHSITLAIATQGSRSADLAITIPNPGNAVTATNLLSDADTNSYTLAGTYTLSNALTITPTTNQLVLGTTRTITLSATQPASASRTYTFPDMGAASNILMSSNALVDNSRVNSAGYIIGTVVQKVQFIDTATTTSSGTGYTATTTTASITPKATTHQIRISVTGSMKSSSTTANDSIMTVFRGATDLDTTGNGFQTLNATTTVANDNIPCTIANFYDSPASTSSLTYTVYIKADVGGQNTKWNNPQGTAFITLEEIAF